MQCTFCGHDIARGTGKMYVKTDGRIFYFCSNKCEKNLIKLHHIPRETRWTSEHRRLKETGKSGAKETPEAKPAKKAAKKEA